MRTRTGSRIALTRRWPLFVLAAAAALLGLACAAGLRVNTTASMPIGLYRERAPSFQRGALVVFCLDGEVAALGRARGYLPAGRCRSGTQELVKRVAALPGDWVELSTSGLRINGRTIARTALHGVDHAGRPLPHPSYGLRRVDADELWVLGAAPDVSWDSRYFGPIRRTQARASAVSVWTVGGSDVGVEEDSQ